MKKVFATFLVSVFAAFTGTAHADEKEVDANELYKEPICRLAPSIQNFLKTLAGQESTGITASNAKWEMEIYLDKTEGDWSLVGKDKSPDASPRKLCVIAKGLSSSPYVQQKWYATDFRASHYTQSSIVELSGITGALDKDGNLLHAQPNRLGTRFAIVLSAQTSRRAEQSNAPRC